MMNCKYHLKKVENNCGWCGKPLCKNCSFETYGIKTYCSTCATKLSKIKKPNLPKEVAKINEPEKKSVGPDKVLLYYD